jgi:hypothetical protein
MIPRRWRSRLRLSNSTVSLALLAALIALGLAFFLRSYYSYNQNEYRPFDAGREKVILEGREVNR